MTPAPTVDREVRELRRAGFDHVVLDLRRLTFLDSSGLTFFQDATVREFCEPVERITGRTILAFHSSIDTEAEGMAVETSVFWPEGKDGPSRLERAEP